MIRLIALFYRPFALLSNLTTVAAVWLLVKTDVSILPVLVIFKIIIWGMIYWLRTEYGSKTLCYFTNRGITPRALWGWSIFFDLIIFAICAAAVIIR